MKESQKTNAKGTQTRRRRRRRRRLSAFAWMLIVCVVLAAAGVAAAYRFLKVGRVEVTGKTRYTVSQVIEASGIKTGSALLRINRKSAAADIRSRLPYIGSANVRYHIPTGIVISVTADKPSLLLQYKDGYAVCDDSGKVLELVKDAGAFPTVTVVSDSGLMSPAAGKKLPKKYTAAFLRAEAVRRSIIASGLEKIKSISVGNIYEMTADYDGRVKIVIGTQADLDRKLRFAASLLKNQDDIRNTEKGVLDVSQSAQNNRASFIPS